VERRTKDDYRVLDLNDARVLMKPP
jgi:hypothetical protein